MTTVTLPADLGIESAQTLKETLAAHVSEEALQVDASQTSRLHCASLQLLAAFVTSRNAQSLSTGVTGSPAFDQAAALLGLESLLSATPADLSSTH